MKYLFIILNFILVSCTFEESQPLVIKESGKKLRSDICEFTYKNHSYIGFWNYKSWGVVHDPECEYCKNTK